jgi:DNA-binding HxlR family transcriptional regulator
MLSTRLQELEEAGMIFRVENQKVPRFVRWNLTEKGWDALPILMSYVAFGSKWYAPAVFSDRKPREMNEIYPQESLKELYVSIEVDKRKMKKFLED